MTLKEDIFLITLKKAIMKIIIILWINIVLLVSTSKMKEKDQEYLCFQKDKISAYSSIKPLMINNYIVKMMKKRHFAKLILIFRLLKSIL